MHDSWVHSAIQEMEHVVCMLTAAAASATGAPASGPLLAATAAAAGGAGSSVQRSPHLQAQAQQGPQPASPVNPQEAAAASRAATQRMMDMLVPMELQRWQWHKLRDTDSYYSGAFAMRPLREWLALRGDQFGQELVAAIILRFG